jgi:hypothetical protein
MSAWKGGLHQLRLNNSLSHILQHGGLDGMGNPPHPLQGLTMDLTKERLELSSFIVFLTLWFPKGNSDAVLPEEGKMGSGRHKQ